MNKNFLEHYMKTTPETVEQKYLFLVDNQELAFAIVCAGFSSTTLLSNERGYYDVDNFIKYMDEISCTGTSQTDYIYVPACFNKQSNDILDMEIVDYLLQTVHFFMLGSTPYLYKNGCYHEDYNGFHLKAHIQNLIFHDCIKATTIQNVYNLLTSQPQVQKQFTDLNNQPSHWVNFKNGYFDVMEWKLIEHDTKYLMINQIPFSFYPDQIETVLEGGKQIRKYLDFSISDLTDQQTFWQYLGYCMTTDTRFQKFLMERIILKILL